MARYATEGHRVSVVTCTDGSRGEVLNPPSTRLRCAPTSPNSCLYSEAGAPWSPRKLHYTTVSNPERTLALDAACARARHRIPFAGCQIADGPPDPSTTLVDVRGHLHARGRRRRKSSLAGTADPRQQGRQSQIGPYALQSQAPAPYSSIRIVSMEIELLASVPASRQQEDAGMVPGVPPVWSRSATEARVRRAAGGHDCVPAGDVR